MKWVRLAFSLALAVVLIGALFVVLFGIPAQSLIASLTRDFAAKNDLAVGTGAAKLTVWPETGLVVESIRVQDRASGEDLLTVDRARLGASLGDLITGNIRITEVALTKPVIRVDPIINRAPRGDRAAGAKDETKPSTPLDRRIAIDSISVDDGVFIVRDGRETAEIHLDTMRLAASLSATDKLDVSIKAVLEKQPIQIALQAEGPSRLLDGKAVPVTLKMEAAGKLTGPLAVTAQVLKTGPALRVNDIAGTLDQGRIAGSLAVSFASQKPFIDANFESDRLDLTGLLGPTSARPAGNAASARTPGLAPWSDKPISFFGLRLFEGNAKLSAREVMLRNARIAPVSIEASLLKETIGVVFAPAGAYRGEASGELAIDISREAPASALRVRFAGLDAYTVLNDTIDFQYVEGQARGNLDLRTWGASPKQMISNLQGTADLLFENGAVRGINAPQMIRSLLDTILSGWQESGSGQTRFSTFSASFRIENGLARTENLRFSGPYISMPGAGTVDLPMQTLNFRVDPKLVSAPDSQQGRAGDTWSIGVPVLIQGPWSEPRIYADLPNILANPEAVLNRFKGAFGVPNSQSGASFGKFIEGLTQGAPGGADRSKTDPLQGGGAAIVDELLKAFGGGIPAAPGATSPAAPATPDRSRR
jgi:AsmA protein